MNERDRRALEAARASARIALEHVQAGGPDWGANQMVVDAAAKRVEEVGEHLKRVTPEQQAAMPGIAWKQAKGMRERIAHDYARVDIDVLEGVINTDLPTLIRQIDAAITGSPLSPGAADHPDQPHR